LPASHATERVHVDAADARAASEVHVVGRFNARLADAVAGRVAVLLPRIRLLLRNLPHVAQYLRCDPAAVVVAQGTLADLHAGEVVLVLEQVVDLRVGNVGFDRDRCQEVVLALLEIAFDAAVGHLQEPGDPAKRLLATLGRELVEGGRPELRDRAGNVRYEHVAVPVDDRPPLRGRTERAHLVVPRVLEVGLPGDHLQRPEAEEEDAEDRHGEDAHDGDA
jgi:hypothetical protein